MIKTVTFPRWPTWNPHLPELDVQRIVSVAYFDKHKNPQSLPLDKVRLAVGITGVSSIVLKEKHELPETAERDDAVTVEYEV